MDLFVVPNIDKIRSVKNGKIYPYYTVNEIPLAFEKSSYLYKIYENKVVPKPDSLKEVHISE